MPEYKLIYFNEKNRAELARMLFVLADVKYTDFRLERAEFPPIKESFATGNLPALEVEGKSIVLNQTMAISRFLAQTFNLAGADSFEQAQANAVVDTVNELMESWRYNVKRIKPADEKAAASAHFKTELAPKHLAKLERIIAAYGSADQKFSVGSSFTWADVAVYAYISTTPLIHEAYVSTIANLPRIEAVYKNVEANERIAKWVKERPDTVK